MRTVKRALLSMAPAAAALFCGSCGAQSETESETRPDPSHSSSDAEDPGLEPISDTEPQPLDEPGTSTPFCGGGVAEDSEQDAEDLPCDLASTPCGGDVIGTWNVMDCPLELTGQVDVKGFGLGCAFGTTLSGSLQVSGTWIADAMGNVCDTTTTQGVHEFALPAACLEVGIVAGCASLGGPLSNLGYDTMDCVDDPETGGCSCSGTFNQQGGLAAISFSPSETGSYSVTGTLLTIADRGMETTYRHCVMGDAMVWTLEAPGKVGRVVGSIVLQKQ